MKSSASSGMPIKNNTAGLTAGRAERKCHMAKEISYEITKAIGVISTSKSGWTREVNLISWNGNAPKIDIRDWNPEHDRMGKGVTLSEDEAQELVNLLYNEGFRKE